MSRFGEASKRDLAGLQKHASAPSNDIRYRYAARMLVDAAEMFSAFRAFCGKSETLSGGGIDNLETVFCIAEAMREADIRYVEIDGRPYELDRVINEMQIWTWKIYQQYPLTTRQVRSIACPETYDRFFRVARDECTFGRLTVITTNYDLVYECHAYMTGVPCVYPSEQIQESNAGNDGRSRFCSIDAHDTGGVPIYKLHGSINYFYDPSPDAQDGPLVFTDLTGDRQIGKSRLAPRVPAILAVDAIWNIRQKLGERLTPAIVPPTYAKLTRKPWLRAIWNRAFQALVNAKKIVFIGYSMPDSDGFMRALIHGALASREVGVPPKIHVINPDEGTKKRYQSLFSDPVMFWSKKLGEITDAELHQVLST